MNVNSYRYIVGLKQTRVHSRTRVQRPKVMSTLVSQNICFNVAKDLGLDEIQFEVCCTIYRWVVTLFFHIKGKALQYASIIIQPKTLVD